ncbi:hypothetical protein [Pseudonocardia endophytica]|uniref:hypothetical protein n=1 Tax=Pseudonocardia endophytica TaxID=401976 RepID=UPI001047F11C|nr:hypothetical protein [Pseudonocardia endophytica]
MTETGNGAARDGGPGRNGYARGSFDRERQGRSAYLVGVLARALSTQVEEIARHAAPTPDGWWFTEPNRQDTATAGAAAPATDEREEHR